MKYETFHYSADDFKHRNESEWITGEKTFHDLSDDERDKWGRLFDAVEGRGQLNHANDDLSTEPGDASDSVVPDDCTGVFLSYEELLRWIDDHHKSSDADDTDVVDDDRHEETDDTIDSDDMNQDGVEPISLHYTIEHPYDATADDGTGLTLHLYPLYYDEWVPDTDYEPIEPYDSMYDGPVKKHDMPKNNYNTINDDYYDDYDYYDEDDCYMDGDYPYRPGWYI